jgi:hypothetical protein
LLAQYLCKLVAAHLPILAIPPRITGLVLLPGVFLPAFSLACAIGPCDLICCEMDVELDFVVLDIFT